MDCGHCLCTCQLGLELWHSYGAVSLSWNVSLMLAAGLFVNGPYALITTAVSADLGSHASVAGMTPWLALPHCCFRRSCLYGSR